MIGSSLVLLALLGRAPQAECLVTAERTATLPVSGAELARIAARAGSLRIEGRPGLTEIRARGTACASSRAELEGIRLVAGRAGGEISLEVEMPESDDGRGYASLDLVVEVPEALALEVIDTSGDLVIRNVASLRLEDSSGEVDASGVDGAVEIDDSSGNVTLRGVRGDVVLRDSSGDLEVSEVGGSVDVQSDSSGDIRISDVTRNAVVRRDSSGNIRATGVRGDFTVERDGSGSIRYSEVRGRVSVPDDR